jgi:hypothetical protein
MFGNTFEIVGLGKTVNDGVGGGALADYVRWEFAPGDRARVLAALKGEAPRRQIVRRVVRALRSRRQAAVRRKAEFARVGHGVRRPLSPIRALETGFLYRAFP